MRKNIKYYDIYYRKYVLQMVLFLKKLYKSFQAFCFSKCKLVNRKKICTSSNIYRYYIQVLHMYVSGGKEILF